MASGGGGYDISQSTSEANTLGFNTRKGNFAVGSGIKIPEWFWPVAAIAAAVVLWKWLATRKR